MDREEAIRRIKQDVLCTNYLTKSKGSNMYVCPCCGSGTGANGTGALKYYEDSNAVHCHACGVSMDVIDIYCKVKGCDFTEAINELAGIAGVEVDTPHKGSRLTEVKKEPQKEQEPKDYTEYYKECAARLSDPEAKQYLHSRGISISTAELFHIGYDPKADPAHSGYKCKRIILPTTPTHYVGRSIEPTTPKEYQKLNEKGVTPGIFNEEAIYKTEGALFVTEGAFDALSIYEASGEQAIALNSTSNAKQLLARIEDHGTKATIILSLDNDNAGHGATPELQEGLKALHVPFITANICGSCKDPNEALTTNRNTFADAIRREVKQATAPDSTSNYIDTILFDEIARFKSDKKTGFSFLDEKTNGLYSGLYCIGAISSLGKTTFALQLADQLATAGHHVMFFSLEQSRLELITKSLTRLQAMKDPYTTVTSLALRKGLYRNEMQEAIDKYKALIGDRMSIIEGNMKCTVSYIAEKVRNYIYRRNERPVVFIDYLQILQSEDAKQGAREAIDFTLTELKRLSRELDITIFIISSLNRSNYLTPVDFESFKESGGIEYTCDVVWGLQLACMNEALFAEDKKIKQKRDIVRREKSMTPRRVELVCIKNRYGISSYSCFFKYEPARDLFKEDVTENKAQGTINQKQYEKRSTNEPQSVLDF